MPLPLGRRGDCFGRRAGYCRNRFLPRRFLELLGAAASRSGTDAKVYCIDTWENNAMSEGSRNTMDEFLANTHAFSKWIVPIRGWSTEVVDQVRERVDKVNLLFIDGDHSYENCLADWTTYRPLLSKRAIVVMHDIGWAEGVQRVVEEEIRPQVIKEGLLPNMWWGCIGD